MNILIRLPVRFLGLSLALLVMVWALPSDAATKRLRVAGGPEGSAEMAAATGLCNFMNQELDLSGYACETVAAPGAGDGLRALRAGAVDLAFVDSNLVDNATDRQNLRTILTMFPKLLTVATTRRSAIRIEDLHRSKVALGPAGSQSARLFDIMQDNRLFRSRFELEQVVLSSQQARIEALCNGDVDAAAFVVSHPSIRIDDLADSCEVEIISVCCDRKQREFLQSGPAYLQGTITGGFYPGSRQSAQSIGVRSLLVSASGLPDSAAALVVEIVTDGFDRFRMLDRSLFNTTPKIMATSETPLIRHPAAIRSFSSRALN
ncbi:MAG: TAXI family TRAP transporter solute-binding subunit [Rhodospirillales bacterium]